MRSKAGLLAAAPLMAAAWLAVLGGGCDGPCASGLYNCPPGGGWVYLPDDLPAPLATVTADLPCVIVETPAAGGRYIGVQVQGTSTARCAVRATLTDGTPLFATLSFEPLMCCGTSSAAPQMLAPVGAAAADAATD